MTVLRTLSLALLSLLVLAAGPGGKKPQAAHAPARAVAPAHAAWTSVVARTPDGGWRLGNPAAPLKLVEFGSRSCPVCGRFYADGATALRTRYIATGKVSWEFHDFPIHPQDIGNSLVGRCVPDSAYFTILDQMYVDQRTYNARAASLDLNAFGRIQQMQRLQAARAWADALGYTDLLRKSGMNDARIAQCFTPQALAALADRMKADDDKWTIDGTPTFVLNGKRLDNVITWAQLEPLLQSRGG